MSRDSQGLDRFVVGNSLQVVVAFWLCLLPTTAVFITSSAVGNLLALPAELVQTTI